MRPTPLERAARGRVVVDGRELDYFGGCDYLGLATHPRVTAALRAGLERWGISAGASRQTSGDTLEHRALEEELADFLRQEAALLLPEGWLANVALCESLAGACDLALVDARAHPSLPGAARAAGLACVEVAHADPGALGRELSRRTARAPCVLTDGVFPSLGRCAPLDGLLAALPGDGVLVVDDCHGLGVLGARGRGTLEQLGLADARVVLTGTLSKALGCYGGFVAGPAGRIEDIRARSSAFLGTTPVPPALAAAARVALRLLASDNVLDRLRRNVALLRGALAGVGLALPALAVPVVALEPPQALALHEALLAEGLLVPCLRYPGGPGGDADGAWLRIAVSAAHEPAAIQRLAAALAHHLPPSVA